MLGYISISSLWINYFIRYKFCSNGNGRLLLLERGFSQACYLQGNVTDLNNQTISGVDVVILNTVIPNLSNTDILGNYTTEMQIQEFLT